MKRNPGFFTKQTVLAGLIAGGGILAASAYAVATDRTEDKPSCEPRHWQQAGAEWEGKRAAHLSELKAKLNLTAEQEAAWIAFTEATQPGPHRLGMDRRAMHGEFEQLSTPQRIDRMLEMSDRRRAAMMARAEAIKAFYAQLSPEQQSVFDAEAMPRRQHHGHHRYHS